MLRTVVTRVLATVPVLLLIVLAVFLLLELMPGDPARVIAGEGASEAAIEQLRQQLGTDRPVLERYLDYVGDVVQGDLGTSLLTFEPVADAMRQAAPVTLSLAIGSLAVTLLLGVPAGTVAALRRGSLVDRAVTAASAVLVAVPPFVLALWLIVLFAVNRSWLPAGGYVGITSDPLEWARRLVLPSFALAVAPACEVARQTRGAVADALAQDYVTALRAAGLRARTVLTRHVAKASSVPVVTVVGLQVGRLLGGTAVVEQVFGMSGMGTLGVRSVLNRDLPMTQGIVLVSAVIVVLTNLLVDLLYPVLDPRQRR